MSIKAIILIEQKLIVDTKLETLDFINKNVQELELHLHQQRNKFSRYCFSSDF